MNRNLYSWIVIAAMLACWAGCGSDTPPESAPEPVAKTAPVEEPPPTTPPVEEPTPEPAPEPTPVPKTEPAPKKVTPKAPSAPTVVMTTSKGVIRIELDPAKAPLSTENFLKYVDDKFYDGTIFHRVIPNFMIQGGGFTTDMQKKETRAPIQNEAKNGLRNLRGTIAMARTQNPHSATAQFYINHVDNPMLDQASQPPGAWGYAVFGKVVEGMDVVDAIASVRTGLVADMPDVPLDQVVIESVRRAR
ncbi:MAG: peptidylprolyl isomerase [Bryobacterales bacterium]